MERLCLIFNIAPHYRKGIFKLIEKTYNCFWYFGTNNTDIQELDLSLFHNVKKVATRELLGNWYWQKGIFGLASKYDHFFVLGDVYCLSTWVLSLWLYFCNGKNIYYWSHGWYGRESRLKRLVKKLFFRLADGIFLYGNYAKNLMIKEGFPEDKLYVVHNSLDYKQQLQLRKIITVTNIYNNHFNNENKTIIFVGRLTKVKKLDLLIGAIATLGTQNEKYNLVLVGDGEARSELENYANKKNVNVWFYGACYDENKNAELIYNADLCVSPGNVGLTAIYSMMFGTPVVTHSSFERQMPEFEVIEENVTGSFFIKDDARSLALTISRWFSEHLDRDAVRQNCYHKIDDSWNPSFQIEVIKSNLK